MIQDGIIAVPPLQTALDGMDCPTTRDFSVVDQDQSDNVVTTYLIRPSDNRLAQNTAKNRKALNVTNFDANGSDNRLLDAFILPALGCQPWMAPDLADDFNLLPALPLNEIQAAYWQCAPQALVPANDPMVLDGNGNTNALKINAYRSGVFQPTIVSPTFEASTTTYCQNLLNMGLPRIMNNQALFMNSASPTAGMNLFDFLIARFNVTFGPAGNGGLGCTTFLGMSFGSLSSITISNYTAAQTSCAAVLYRTTTTNSSVMSPSVYVGIGAACVVGVGCIAAGTVLGVRRIKRQKAEQSGNAFYAL